MMQNAIMNDEMELNKLLNELNTIMNSDVNSTTNVEENVEPGTGIPEGWDENKVYVVESEDGKKVPVPFGFVPSTIDGEKAVETGFVIKEGEDGSLTEGINEFVWVPVPDINKMYGIDSKGKKWGKSYEFSSSGVTNDNWNESNGFITILSQNDCREPDIVPKTETDSSLPGYRVGATTQAGFKTQMELEFEEMLTSVEKYSGFYIGRYETGNLSQAKPVVQKNNTDISNQTWYTMYNKCKLITTGVNNSVKTTMIWGSQWDACLLWMYNSKNLETKKYVYDSTGRGFYDGGYQEFIATGKVKQYSVNNIYDMAGNVGDRTLQAGTDTYRNARGGWCGMSPTTAPASYDYSIEYHIKPSPQFGCRVALVI